MYSVVSRVVVVGLLGSLLAAVTASALAIPFAPSFAASDAVGRIVYFRARSKPGGGVIVAFSDEMGMLCEKTWSELEPSNISWIRVQYPAGENWSSVVLNASGQVVYQNSAGQIREEMMSGEMAASKIQSLWNVAVGSNLEREGKMTTDEFDGDSVEVVKEPLPLSKILRRFVCQYKLRGSTESLKDLVARDVLNVYDSDGDESLMEECGCSDDDDFDDEDDSDDDEKDEEEGGGELFVVLSDAETGLLMVTKTGDSDEEVKQAVLNGDCNTVGEDLAESTSDGLNIDYVRIIIEAKSYEVPLRLVQRLLNKVVKSGFGKPLSHSFATWGSTMYGCEVPPAPLFGEQMEAETRRAFSEFAFALRAPFGMSPRYPTMNRSKSVAVRQMLAPHHRFVGFTS